MMMMVVIVVVILLIIVVILFIIMPFFLKKFKKLLILQRLFDIIEKVCWLWEYHSIVSILIISLNSLINIKPISFSYNPCTTSVF